MTRVDKRSRNKKNKSKKWRSYIRRVLFVEKKRPTPPSRYKCSPKNHFFESAGPRMMACTICGEGCRKENVEENQQNSRGCY